MMYLCALLNFFGFIKKIPVSCPLNISSFIYLNIKLAHFLLDRTLTRNVNGINASKLL